LALGSASACAAVVLRPIDGVRLLPRANSNGTALLFFRAWDQSDGTSPGTAVNMSGNTGGGHAYSTAWDTASLTITAVNDAPVLNKDFSPALNTIAEDATNPSGTVVSSILGGVSDVDSGAVKGIAVTSLS